MNSTLYLILMVAAAVLATMITRFLPFLIFNEKRPMPEQLKKIASALPPAIIAILVVYCLKGYIVSISTDSLAAFIAVISVIFIHLYKKNTLLSIAAGTIVYMILIRIL